jgi:hypothetical protein
MQASFVPPGWPSVSRDDLRPFMHHSGTLRSQLWRAFLPIHWNLSFYFIDLLVSFYLSLEWGFCTQFLYASVTPALANPSRRHKKTAPRGGFS